MRIAVVGAGGVGGYFGTKLARAGASVIVLARGPHLEAIRRHGLRVRSAVEGDLEARSRRSTRSRASRPSTWRSSA
jgi:2-dehydropantoate 2-reductase